MNSARHQGGRDGRPTLRVVGADGWPGRDDPRGWSGSWPEVLGAEPPAYLMTADRPCRCTFQVVTRQQYERLTRLGDGLTAVYQEVGPDAYLRIVYLESTPATD